MPRWGLVASLGAAAAALAVASPPPQDEPFHWDTPAPFPRPPVPTDNPMSAVKVELGRRLFYDRRMSVTGRHSCASCHRQELAFTDGRARAVGATGQVHPRGSMSLANIGYSPGLTWAHPTLDSLEAQALVPMTGTDPVELGLGGREAAFLALVRQDTLYRRLFPASFPRDTQPFTIRRVVQALAAFQRTLVSMRSPYDRYRYGGDTSAISTAAKRGQAIFFSGQRGGCFQCHGGWNMGGAVRHEADRDVPPSFFNNGLYNIAGPTSFPVPNTGLHHETGRAEDVGRFRAPTLRNIAVTAPYMHDGSLATLSDVLDHYAAGGRTIAEGPYAGVGRDNPNKAPSVHGFVMSAVDKADLIAFLETLTDSAFLRNPAFSDPWR